MTSCAWMWMYIGAFLMLAELMLPGFVIFFFGLSAVTVGLFRFALGEPFTLMWQLAAFSAFAILYLAVLRRLLAKLFSGDTETSSLAFRQELVGRVGSVASAINPQTGGRVMIGDAEWNAVADGPIEAGADVKVVAQENLTVRVEKIA